MGKSHGPTSHSRYIIQKSPKGPKSGAEIPQYPLRLALHLRQAVKVPKMVKHDQVSPKTWSRANMPPTLTYDSSRVTLV
jgi:hypothetical protein